jgi:RimJ/RimL family protein N-acetyltransferase
MLLWSRDPAPTSTAAVPAVGEQRAGYIYINISSDEFFGEHPSIQIFINKSERGKQIGRVAYRLASEQSGYNTIYAHMRKSNTASMRAAEEAGFKVVEQKGLPQLSMVWRRKKSGSKDNTAPGAGNI